MFNNFYVMRLKATEFGEITHRNGLYAFITPFKVIQGHRFWYQLKAHTTSYTNFRLIPTYPYLAPFPSYGWLFVKFSLARGECLTSTLSLGVVPCQYRHKWYITKNYILWPTFLPQKVWCIFNHFYVIRLESCRIWWNYAAVRAIYAVQGHSRSPSLVPIESSYASFY